MKLPLLFNLTSGTSTKNPEALLRTLPKDFRDQVEPLPFGPPWDFEPAVEMAQRSGGPLLVWGGDGTIHHAAKALIARGCPVPLGAIPGGSGNGLVRGLRTPLNPAKALRGLLEGRELRMDLPRLDGEPFLNLCGTGFEAAVAHRFDALPGRGFATYARASWELWRSWQKVPLEQNAELPQDSPPFPSSAWSLCFANLPTYGGGLWIAPNADPTDGLLQWATLARPSWFDALTKGPQLFFPGGQSSLREEGRLIKATLRLERPLPWHLDGEPAPERDRAELSLEPRAFRMLVTEGCPWT